MRPVFDRGWTRTGFSLLWDVKTLSQIVTPNQVISMRQLFGYSHNWLEDLPANNGNALVVAGLDACLDALLPEDGDRWLEEHLKPIFFKFQDHYEGQAGLIFWLPIGKQRITFKHADNAYSWRCSPPHSDQEIPIGLSLMAGSEADTGHILAVNDPNTDLLGQHWIGLHLSRLS